MPDSYDLLARSIERVVRSDLPLPLSPEVLSGSIDRIMTEESCAGETRLSYLRVLVVGAFAVLAIDAALRGPALSSEAVVVGLAVTWLGVAVGLAVALRQGWYRRWVPHVMPAVDAAMIAAGFLLPLVMSGRAAGAPSPALVAAVTALCAFLGISGGLRLSRSSMRLGTALAVAVFVVVALAARLGAVPTIAVALTLLATGLLGASVMTLVRRMVTDEVAKATLAHMYQQATLAIDAREQVLKIVSHDLRTPLHTVAMSTNLLMEERLEPEAQQKLLRGVQRAGERMNRLVQDLLDVAKLEAGRVAIAPRDLEVAPLMKEAHEMLQPLAAASSLVLELDVAENLPHLTADAGRVLQVLSNLVSNAVKFTPAGGSITMRARPSPGGVHFSIIDTGPGIPPEQLERIFGRFWQANAADRRGIGLGLSIAKGIVDAHAGRLWAESRVGSGTTFHFVLGTVLPEMAANGSRDGSIEGNGSLRGRRRVGVGST